MEIFVITDNLTTDSASLVGGKVLTHPPHSSSIKVSAAILQLHQWMAAVAELMRAGMKAQKVTHILLSIPAKVHTTDPSNSASNALAVNRTAAVLDAPEFILALPNPLSQCPKPPLLP